MATAVDPFYHRRVDRSPERPEYFGLPNNDRRLVCQLREAMEGARDKVTTLRDEVEDKERDVSREAALRRAAEARLEQLIDMYGDPSVNQELQERLPRAHRAWRAPAAHEELLQRQPRDLRSESPSQRRDPEDSLQEETIGTSKTGRSHSPEPRSKTRSRGRSHDSHQTEGRRRSLSPSPSRTPGYQHHAPPFGAPYPGAPYPGYYAPPPAPYYPMAAPQMYAYSPGQAHTAPPGVLPQGAQGYSPGGAVGAAGFGPQSFQTMAPMMAHPGAGVLASGAVNGHLHGGPVGGASGALSGDSVVGGFGSISAMDTPAASRPPGLGIHSISTPNLAESPGAGEGTSSLRDVTASREQKRQISLLLAELDAAREQIKKLETKLSSTERELHTLQQTSQLQQAAADKEVAERITALVEEIYRAQQQRDEAMLGRLRTANEERDEALLKLRHRETSGTQPDLSSAELPSDVSLHEMLQQLEGVDEGPVMERQVQQLATNIHLLRRRERDITTEEMRAVLEERDNAVTKSKKMEQELMRLQRQVRGHTPERQQHATAQSNNTNKVKKEMRAKLLATQQERDMALTKVRKLEEELQTLQVYYSLHKSLSQEANMRDQFNNTLDNIEGELKQRDNIVDWAQKENNKLIAQMRSLQSEKVALAEQLSKSDNNHKECRDNCEKLERLVNVLRKKLNGLGSKADQ